MKSEHPLPSKREREVFHGALEQTSLANRAVFLDLECGNDHALRASVEALVKNLTGDNLIGEFAEKIRPAKVEGERLGDTIGGYKLLEKIGEGGCGVVYRVVQVGSLNLEFALKVLKPGIDDHQVSQRFQTEAKILSQLHHSNIPQISGYGKTPNGRPYFVMERIRGIKITDYADARFLSIYDRLELFLKVCKALQAAHEKGIIHRDIKPSNILVGEQNGEPLPKVIDFGIGKMFSSIGEYDGAALTRTGQFIGTPGYMSPEQAESKGELIDKRTDVYSLGMLLNDLLVGRSPFILDGLGFYQQARIIIEEPPKVPSRIFKELPEKERSNVALFRRTLPFDLERTLENDLDRIVERCLEKDPESRYDAVADIILAVQVVQKMISANIPSGHLQKSKNLVIALLGVGAVANFGLFILFTLASPNSKDDHSNLLFAFAFCWGLRFVLKDGPILKSKAERKAHPFLAFGLLVVLALISGLMLLILAMPVFKMLK